MTRRVRWFATSVVDPSQLVHPGWASDLEATTIHAKEVGTVVTACGRHTTTWHKHWTPFDTSPPASRCKTCAAVVAAEPQRVPDRAFLHADNEG